MKKFFVALCVVFMSQTPSFSQSLDMSQMAYVNSVLDDSVSSNKPKDKPVIVVKQKKEQVEQKIDKSLSIGDMFGMAISAIMLVGIAFILLLCMFAPVRHN